MSNERIFFIFGIALAVSAVLVSLAGLKLKDFPGKAMPVIVLWFAILVGGATTFAVLHAKDEDKARGNEYVKAGKEIEKAESSGPFERAAEESGGAEAEGESGAEGKEEAGAKEAGGSEKSESPAEEKASAEAGSQVFASAGCASCHTFKAAGATGTVGPDLDEVLISGTEKSKIEEDIVDPNAEIAKGYVANIMPGNFGETLNPEELKDVVDFLYLNSPAGEGK